MNNTNKEVEISRHNISARQFYTYCRKMALKKGLDPENYLEYEDWANPISPCNVKNRHEDWKKPALEICKHQRYDAHFYLEGSYNFIMEYDEDFQIGYCYIIEYPEPIQENKIDYVGTMEVDDIPFTVCKVTTKDGVYLEAGTCTNTGFLPSYGVDYGDELDGGLNRLYDHIVECRANDEDAWKDFQASL